jgi:ABC-type glycerol-3-phosphate transport system substrate-binding protein
MNPGRTEIMNRTHSQRRWVSSAAGLSVAATPRAACAAGGGGAQSVEGKPTLNAIFLPATWGQVVKDKLAPEYEKETGVHVEVQLIGATRSTNRWRHSSPDRTQAVRGTPAAFAIRGTIR